MKLTKEEFNNELNYLVSISITKELLESDLISKEEFELIKESLLSFYKPLINTLLEGKPCGWK